VPVGAQEIPQTRRHGAGLVVVGHHTHAWSDTGRAHDALDLLLPWPRMAAGRKTAPAPGRGEVRVHVEKNGARDMPGLIGLAAPARGVEVPAHVRDTQVGRAELGGQPLGGDERLQGEGRGRGGRPPPKGDSIFL
jgi:hypothetical protein